MQWEKLTSTEFKHAVDETGVCILSCRVLEMCRIEIVFLCRKCWDSKTESQQGVSKSRSEE